MKYCPMLAISANWPTPATPGASPPDNANRRDIKRNLATHKGGKEKDASKQPNKKVRLVEPRGVNKKEMGMFLLTNPKLRVSEVFPKDLAQKVCVIFVCKGMECTREPC